MAAVATRESRQKPFVNCKKTAANTAISGNREYFRCENYSADTMAYALFTDDALNSPLNLLAVARGQFV